MGQAYKELAQAAPAIDAYTSALALDGTYSQVGSHSRSSRAPRLTSPQAYFLRGQTHFGAGNMNAALDDFLAAVTHDPSAKDARHMAVRSTSASPRGDPHSP